jgi:hypothetical protein
MGFAPTFLDPEMGWIAGWRKMNGSVNEQAPEDQVVRPPPTSPIFEDPENGGGKSRRLSG